MNLSIPHAVQQGVQLEQEVMVLGDLMVLVYKESVEELDLGQQ
jgi:hypothetical protein